MLAFGTQVRGFKAGRSRQIFQGEKNPQHAFLRKDLLHAVDLRHVKDP